MNYSRKKKHILESNLRLEKRYLFEQEMNKVTTTETTEDPKVKELEMEEKRKKEDVLSEFQETLKMAEDAAVKKGHKQKDVNESCVGLYKAISYGEVKNIDRFARKCFVGLDDEYEKTKIISKMKDYANQKLSQNLPSNQKKTPMEKANSAVMLTSTLLGLWTTIKTLFKQEEPRN